MPGERFRTKYYFLSANKFEVPLTNYLFDQ